MTLEDKLYAQRLRLFRRAAELGIVCQYREEASVSRSLYFELPEPPPALRGHGPQSHFASKWIRRSLTRLSGSPEGAPPRLPAPGLLRRSPCQACSW